MASYFGLGEKYGNHYSEYANMDSHNRAVQHAEVAVGIVVFLDRHGSSLLLLFPVLFLYFDL